MAGAPLPLSLNDIGRYLESRPLLIDRHELEAAIFALDDADLKKWEAASKKGK